MENGNIGILPNMNHIKILMAVGCLLMTNCRKPQAVSSDRKQYLENTRQFIRLFKDSIYLKDSLVISNKAGGHIFSICEEELFHDSAILSSQERREILVQLDHPILKTWTNDLIGPAKIVSQDTLNRIFKGGLHEAWSLFHEKYGRDLRRFSAPIFLRNNTICLFYSEMMCGGLCGEGQLSLYKKGAGQWKLIRTFCNWVS